MSKECKCKDCDCKKVDISLEREIFSVFIRATTEFTFDRCIEVIKEYCKKNGYDFDNVKTMDITYEGKKLILEFEAKKIAVS